MTVLQLPYDDLWAEADLKADPDTWARSLVLNRYQEEGLVIDEERTEALSTVISAVLRALQAEDPSPEIALLLYPQADHFVVTSVALRYEELESAIGLDEVAEVLRLPVEMLEQPTEEEIIQTASGPALRLVQRYLEPVEAGVEQIQENLAYVWTFDDAEGPLLVMLSTTFEDLVDASDWRLSIDELAAALIVKKGT